MKYRELTEQEFAQLQELNRIVAAESLKADIYEQNTSILNEALPRPLHNVLRLFGFSSGKYMASQQRKAVGLITQVRDDHFRRLLVTLGYEAGAKAALDLKSGKITIQK